MLFDNPPLRQTGRRARSRGRRNVWFSRTQCCAHDQQAELLVRQDSLHNMQHERWHYFRVPTDNLLGELRSSCARRNSTWSTSSTFRRRFAGAKPTAEIEHSSCQAGGIANTLIGLPKLTLSPCTPTMPGELHTSGHCWLGGSRACVASVGLLRRAGDRAERAEHAAVAGLGAELRAAVPAIIKNSAGVDGHCLALREAAMRTGDDGMQNGVSHDFLRPPVLPRAATGSASQLPDTASIFSHWP